MCPRAWHCAFRSSPAARGASTAWWPGSRRTTSTAVYTLVAYTTSAVLLAPVCLVAGLPLGGYAARTWVELVVLAVAAQLVGHTLLNAAVPVVGATPLSLAILLEWVRRRETSKASDQTAVAN